jgi:CRP/FNR family transcriptional regulator
MEQQRNNNLSASVSEILEPEADAQLEVECKNCDLDPLCSILDYANDGSGVPEGILLRHRHLSRGETIFRKDDPFRSLFTVKSGSFKTYVPNGSGGEQVIGFHLFGELMGAEGLSGGFYPYTTRALESGAVCELRLDGLPETGRSQEDLQQGIIQMLSSEISLNRQLMAAMIHQSAEQRLLSFLSNLSQRLQAKGMPHSQFRLGMSRSDIGNYLGLASETVSRVLTKLQKTGAIELRRKRLTLFQPSRHRLAAKG